MERRWDFVSRTYWKPDAEVPIRPLPHETHTFALKEPSYLVDIEIRFDRDHKPVATGIAVRRRHLEEKPADPEPVSAREFQRLPLTSIMRAALSRATAGSEPYDPDEVDLALAGKEPGVRHGAGHYKAVASTYRRAIRDDLSPAKAIAEEAEVSANTAHAWIHRARKLGFLPPAPPRKRAKR